MVRPQTNPLRRLCQAKYWRTSAGWLLCLFGLLHAGQAIGAETSTAGEQPIKAAFVYNFLKFVEWPASRFEKTNSPIRVGVVGPSPIADALASVVKDRRINGRNILVKTVDSADEAKQTHLLFFPANFDARAGEILAAVTSRGSGVLTVGESPAFAKQHGMITLGIEGDKVRFEITIDAAEQAGLKVSAQLQKLAKTVRRKN